jgi:2-isopropylmalate synthase
MDRVIIFDTTLRDGEQAAGGSLNIREKLEIARQLERLGVDVIEAGFPVTSPGDLEAVKLIAKEVRTPVICVLTHAVLDAVDQTWEAIKGAERPRIHIVLSASDIHLFYQLRKSRDEILQMSRDTVARARKYCDDVEFSAMDASRTEPEYIYQIMKEVIDAGATTVNIPEAMPCLSSLVTLLMESLRKSLIFTVQSSAFIVITT